MPEEDELKLDQELLVKLDEELLRMVEERAKELGLDKELAALELMMLGLERIGKLRPPNVRGYKAATEEYTYYLRIGNQIYQTVAETPRQAVVEQLRLLKATNTALKLPKLAEQGQWVFEVVGLQLEGQAISKIEVFDKYPKG